MSTPSPDPRPSILQLLAERARSQAEEPWLFHRPRWQWRWRSWGQVADQVARGASVLRDLGPRRVAFAHRLDPDALAAGLAIEAAGKTAVAADEPADGMPMARVARREDAAVSGERIPPVLLPSCRPHFGSWRPAPLELADAPGGLAPSARSEALPHLVFDDAARRFAALLPASPTPGSDRPILCASPTLDPVRVRALLAWTVHAGAAWVLEPEPDAFLAAVLWSRPTLVVASADELATLAASYGERAHRRHRRLSAVVAAGEPPADRSAWQGLGVAARYWDVPAAT